MADGGGNAQKPIVRVRGLVMPDYFVCLEEGKKLKTLKRQLRLAYSLPPAECRSKWNYRQTIPCSPQITPSCARNSP